MDLADVLELHNITPIQNLPSILEHGILCNHLARKLPHESVALERVQETRSKIDVPGGMKLHKYANLYFHARNPMMYKRKAMHQQLCVLRVSPDVLHLPGVVITDQNASSDYRRFAAAPEGVKLVDKELVFAADWRHADQIQYWRRKSIKCAEVLVPHRVDIQYVIGAYVSCKRAEEAFRNVAPSVPVSIHTDLFFQ